MNLISGSVRHGRVICAGNEFEVGGDSLRILEGESITLGIRPEHLEIGDDGGANIFALEVDIIQKLLSDRSQLVTFRMGAVDVVGKFDLGEEFDRGDKVRINFRADVIRIFNSRDICVL